MRPALFVLLTCFTCLYKLSQLSPHIYAKLRVRVRNFKITATCAEDCWCESLVCAIIFFGM